MTLKQILDKANEGYPDGRLEDYYDEDGYKQQDDVYGTDTLAKFIVLELIDTFDPNASDEEQEDTAWNTLETAVRELSKVQRQFV